MDYSKFRSDIAERLITIEESCGGDQRVFAESCAKLQEYANRTFDDELLGFLFFYLSKNAYLRNDIGDLFKYCIIGIEYQEKSEQWQYIALSYNLLGITSAYQGNSAFAIDYYLNGQRVCEEHGLEKDAYAILMNIGNLYLRVASYDDAEICFQRAMEVMQGLAEDDSFFECMAAVYINLGFCALSKKRLDVSQEYLDWILQRLYKNLPPLDKLGVKLFQAQLYYAKGKEQVGDIIIDEVMNDTKELTLILEMYDDFYHYAQFLFNIGKDEQFLHTVELLKTLADTTKINYIRREYLALLIEYYRRTENQEQFYLLCAEHFEIMQKMEAESKFTVASVINVRTRLEDSRKRTLQIKLENEQLHKKSETDALTGLPNRFSLNRYAEAIFQHCYVNRAPLAVEILDIDYFKQFNDNYGHQAGDMCIVTVAEVLKELVEEFDVYVARYGGDEFIIIYHDKPQSDVMYIAGELKRRMTDRNVKHEYSLAMPYVTVSQGICFAVPEPKNKIWDYLYSADKILYNVKKKSRNDFGMGECELMEH